MELGCSSIPTAWLSTSGGAMTAIVITKVWLSIPLFMAFFLAGLQSLDKRAAGGRTGRWRRQLGAAHSPRPAASAPGALMVVLVLGVIGNLQQFDTIFALTGGGPVRATTTLSIEVYRRAFESWDIGLASTVGVLWVATILPPAAFYLRQLLEGGRVDARPLQLAAPGIASRCTALVMAFFLFFPDLLVMRLGPEG